MRPHRSSHRREKTARSAARSSGACSTEYECKAQRRPSARLTWRRDASELHLRRLIEDLALLGAHVEEFLLREAERPRQQHRRELLDPGIVFLHGVVEEAARGGELILDIAELGLELLEV